MVCQKSSCYPCYSHVAIQVNQDMYYLSAASFPYTPLFPDSYTKLPKIFKGKADSANKRCKLPPSYGEGIAMLYEYLSTAPLPSLCRKHADAPETTSLTQHQTQSISYADIQRFLMTAGLISKSTPVMVKRCSTFVQNNLKIKEHPSPHLRSLTARFRARLSKGNRTARRFLVPCVLQQNHDSWLMHLTCNKNLCARSLHLKGADRYLFGNFQKRFPTFLQVISLKIS